MKNGPCVIVWLISRINRTYKIEGLVAGGRGWRRNKVGTVLALAKDSLEEKIDNGSRKNNA